MPCRTVDVKIGDVVASRGTVDFDWARMILVGISYEVANMLERAQDSQVSFPCGDWRIVLGLELDVKDGHVAR